MSDELTLPGSIPGLLRRGSPVWHPRFGRGIMLDPADPVNPAVFERVGNAVWSAQDLRDAPGLALDLTDATGRAHVCWWLDMKVRGVSLAMAALCEQPEWWNDEQSCHSAIATLDPNDPRTLPDGSRWVDAEALRLVCLHVAGLEVPRG